MGDAHDDAGCNLDAYAAIAMEVAEADADRDAVLARHGLDAAQWDRIEEAWHERMSRQGDDPESDEVPPLVAAYAEAIARAQSARAESSGVAPFEQYADAMRLLERGGDVPALLMRAGLTMRAFLRANQYWTARIVREPELAARFEQIMR